MYVVFDLETTGFDRYNCDVIEFSYLAFDDFTNALVKAETLYFYYPGMSWSEDAYAVHKISREFLKQHADKFDENLIKMFTVLNLGKVCGHNAREFDCKFAEQWLMRMGMPQLEFTQIEDTMTMFQSITKTSRISLAKLRARMGVEDDVVDTMRDLWYHGGQKTEKMSAHNAEWDVTATALILMKGINNGFCSFKPRDPNEKLPDINFDDLDFGGTSTDIFNHENTVYLNVYGGNAYAVNLMLKEQQSLSVDDRPYLDASFKHQVFPEKFYANTAIPAIPTSNDNNTFVCSINDTKWIFIKSEEKPELYLVSSDGSITCAPDNFNFTAYLQRMYS